MDPSAAGVAAPAEEVADLELRADALAPRLSLGPAFWEAVTARGYSPEDVARVVQGFSDEFRAGDAPSELECAAQMVQARKRLDARRREQRAEIRARRADPLGEKIAVAFRSGWGKAARPTGRVRHP